MKIENESVAKKRGNLTLIFNHFEEEHLGKDVFLVPYYLGRRLDYDVTIVYPHTITNNNFSSEHRGVRLVPLKFKVTNGAFSVLTCMEFLFYLLKHAKEIDVLMCFHHTISTSLMICLYKWLNKKGKSYIKLDLNAENLKKEELAYSHKHQTIKDRIGGWLRKESVLKLDCASCETRQSYQLLKQTNLPYMQFGDKLVYMPNGFDEEMLQSLHIHERIFSEKENLIITVGRLGTFEKNTQMLLRALSNLDLKNWKVCLIGSVAEEFQPIIDIFYQTHPEKAEQVIFTGPIYDKKELWEYYNRSKVFVLTSRWESYAFVLNEAKRFRNYLLSTDVGAYQDLSEHGKYGFSLPQDDDKDLTNILNEIIVAEKNVDVYQECDFNELSWQRMVQALKL